MKIFKCHLIYTATLIILIPLSTYAQELSLGVDLVNRYIWRGFDLGANAPSIQPNIALNAGSFILGFWGAYSFTNEVDQTGSPRPLDEIDFYANYNLALEKSGSINVGFTDYMNPNSGIAFSNFKNYDVPGGPGAHYIEFNAGYSGPEAFPVSLSFNIFLYNVKDNPIYFQAGYNTSIKDIEFSIFAGGTPKSTAYYGTNKFDFLNIGFSASKSVAVSDKFNLPIFGSVLINPSTDQIYYIIGIKL
jgi:Bacterial protein of unknown function (Gcw_chp)